MKSAREWRFALFLMFGWIVATAYTFNELSQLNAILRRGGLI